MRIFIFPGTYDCANLGDLAMLQMAVERLKALWPDAELSALMDRPGAFKIHCPEVRPVSRDGHQCWLKAGGSPWRNFLRPARFYLARRFSQSLLRSDLVVLSGAGFMADPFQNDAVKALKTLRAAQRQGIPTVMLGQGIGPIQNQELWTLAAEVLPQISAIFIREQCATLPLLKKMRVPEEKIFVTGDDAVEMAFREKVRDPGKGLGVNMRMAGYSQVQNETIETIREALAGKARQLKTDLVGIPIKNDLDDSDMRTLERLLPGSPAVSCRTPIEAIHQTARCRVVVAGSYHAGVFALAQGIPVVAIVQSDYYQDKFQGLAAQFGTGCIVLHAGENNFTGHLSGAVDQLWTAAGDLRTGLLAAAQRQIGDAQRAYAGLRDKILLQ